MSTFDETRQLKEKLERAIEKDRPKEALEILDKLEFIEADKARWPHRRGDILRKLGQKAAAIEAYERGVSLYAVEGFIARAIALAKLVVDLDPSRTDVLEKVDPKQARRRLRPDVAPPIPPPEARRPIAAPGPTGPSTPPAAARPTPPPPAARPTPPPAPPGPTIPVRPTPPPVPTAPVGVRSSPPPATNLRTPDARPPIARSVSEFDIELDSLADYSVLDVAHRANDFEVEIDLSEIQVEARPHGPIEEEPSADVLASLPAFPLFADCPQAALLELVRGADLVELTDGETVVRQGAPADELFAIIEGRVRVGVEGLPPELQPVLTEGDLFGESCLLENEPRKADVFVEGRLFALRIPRLVLKTVIAAHPKLGEILFQLLTRRLVGNLMQSSPLFTAFDPVTRKELARLFEVRRMAAGANLFEEGRRADALYIPLTGRVELRSKARGEGDLAGPGAVLGHESIFFNRAADATARCGKEMALLCLPAASFGRVASQYPPVLAHLAEMSAEPSADLDLEGSGLL